MRQLVIIILFSCIAFLAWTQGKPTKGTSFKAESLLQSKKLDEAKTEVNNAINYEIYKAKSKGKLEVAKTNTYYVRGQIYEAIAAEAEGQAIDEYLTEAIKSYNKAVELKGSKESDPLVFSINQKLSTIYSKYANLGVEDYNKENYKDAIANFERASLAIPEDTNLYVNIISSAAQIDDKDRIMKYGEKLLALDFKKEYIYSNLTQLAFEKEDYENAAKYALKGVANFPTNQRLVNYLVESYIKSNSFDKGIVALKGLIEKQSKDAYLPYVLGYMYERNKDVDNAIKAYEQALKLNDEMYEAIYNVGLIHYNRGVEHNKIMSELQDENGNVKDSKKFNDTKIKRDKELKASIPYLEKAAKLKSNEASNYELLYQIYYSLGQKDKQQEIMDILDTFDN